MIAREKSSEGQTRRKGDRYEGSAMISIRIAESLPIVRGVMLNWSASGAGILLESDTPLPAKFELLHKSRSLQDITVPCELRWQHKSHIGIGFVARPEVQHAPSKKMEA